MKTYQNKSGNSGIKAYDFTEDGIKIKFADGSVYLYNIQSSGKRAIQKMKELAASGIGLTTFINQKIRERFAKKIK